MDYALFAMDLAKQLGADYADIRIQRTRGERLYVRNQSLLQAKRDDFYGYGIRVFKNGAWGFAHNNTFNQQAVKETVNRAFAIAISSARVSGKKGLSLATERSYIDTFSTKVEIDPFLIPMKEKVEMMLEVTQSLLRYDAIKQATFYISTESNDKIFASTLGTYLTIKTTHIIPAYTAVAVADGDSQSRSYNPGGKTAGWEYINELNMLGNVDRVAEEAIMKVRADNLGEEQRRDLILMPDHLALTMHESVGHPTELDRVLGWEADFAGISFATPEKLRNYQYASPLVNFMADNLLEGGNATAGYDDDGVPNQKWHIIKDGILQEYGSTRDTAPIIGLSQSRGCSRATYYSDFPINRIPNLYLEAGKEPLSLSELIESTEDAVYIEGQGSFSIDQHRVNFQFGGDLFWEIKNGKKTRMLKKVIYKSHNPEFWNSVDAICDQRFWKSWGVNNCGKGQPSQTGRMTHGAAPARFRQIRVGGSK